MTPQGMPARGTLRAIGGCYDCRKDRNCEEVRSAGSAADYGCRYGCYKQRPSCFCEQDVFDHDAERHEADFCGTKPSIGSSGISGGDIHGLCRHGRIGRPIAKAADANGKNRNPETGWRRWRTNLTLAPQPQSRGLLPTRQARPQSRVRGSWLGLCRQDSPQFTWGEK